MNRILLTQPLHPEAVKLVKGRAEIVLSPAFEDEVVREHVAGVEGMVVRGVTILSRETIFAAESLKAIARTGVGYDNVDVKAASERGIAVCITPEANKTSVAEHAFALLLSLAKRIPQMDEASKNGGWKARFSLPTFDLMGKTMGIVGIGRIGREVAKFAATFGMKVVAYDPFVTAAPPDLQVSMAADLEQLCREVDVLSVHVPLSDETRSLIDSRLLGLMKPTSVVINTARGGIVDEPALIEALDNGTIAAAAVDVFTQEPIPSDFPLLKAKNLIVTPHSAALTDECNFRMSRDALESVLAALNGKEPQFVVNSRELSERGENS